MASPSPKKSPFKAVASKNATHCGYVSMSQLEPDKPYIMYDMKATHHSTYGDGLLSFLRGKNNAQWRSQFPPKYLQNFTAEDIEALRDQITEKKNPIVIFREVLPDKSFKIDLAPYSEEMENAHKLWQDVGAIVLSPDTSIEEPDEKTKNTNGDPTTDDKEIESNPTEANLNADSLKRQHDGDDSLGSGSFKSMKR